MSFFLSEAANVKSMYLFQVYVGLVGQMIERFALQLQHREIESNYILYESPLGFSKNDLDFVIWLFICEELSAKLFI